MRTAPRMDAGDDFVPISVVEEETVKTGYVDRLRRLRRLRRNNQKGFTLIELLVVISILGILAAVVTMSMVGVTQLAQQRARSAEEKTVQLALDTMANEQQVPENAVCTVAAPGVSDMSVFPTNTTSAGLGTTPTGASVSLYPRYLRQQGTHGKYSCASGVVKSESFSP